MDRRNLTRPRDRVHRAGVTAERDAGPSRRLAGRTYDVGPVTGPAEIVGEELVADVLAIGRGVHQRLDFAHVRHA